MKAVVLHEYGSADKLKYEDMADPIPGPGEVLVRLTATSVNPIDFKVRSGKMKEHFPLEFPAILGRDLAGIVRAIGPDVTGCEPGDHVLALANNTYAELVVVKASDLAHIPDGMEVVAAAALPLVTLTGEQLVTLGVKPAARQTILVAGAVGGVGRTAVYVAKQAGATVIAGVRKSQLKEAAEVGADHVLALDDQEALAQVGFLDAIADAVGGPTAELLLGKVKPGGTFATVTGPPANAKLHPTINIVPIFCKPDATALRKLAKAVHATSLTIPIDRMLPLSDAADGQAAAEKGGIGKVLLLA